MDYRKFFRRKFDHWHELEKEIERVEHAKTKGDLFEFFVYFYLTYYKELYQLKEIYCPIVDNKPFPAHILSGLKLESKDFGVDGVFITEDNKIIAWQAKFRTARISPTFTELATFWAEAENADFRLIVANSLYLPKVAVKKQGHLSVLYDHFARLDATFFEALQQFYVDDSREVVRTKKLPRDYQKTILTDIIRGFSSEAKGKLIAACGIGKTLISLWVVQELKSRTIVFFAPSLQLIRQTLEQWSLEADEPFKYLCICSDQTVSNEVDSNNIDADDLDIPVTTKQEDIINFFKAPSNRRKIIFCTYQSADVLSAAIDSASFKAIDLAIYDEAHRTAGVSETSMFSSAVSDQVIPATKKLFMTATERLIRPRLSKFFAEDGREVFSMDDKRFYGSVFHRLSFGEAIEKRIICDYRIVFSGITKKELTPLLRHNYFIKDESFQSETESIDNVYKRRVFEKTIEELDLKKVISFHSKIKEAQNFASQLSLAEKEHIVTQFVSHINGSMSAQERAHIIEQFENSDQAVLTNVRCLTEGIDIPLIDAVFFADPKGSLIDIVQAVGRALRQPYGTTGKIAYVIIPLLLDSDSDDVLSGEGFEALFNLIQALREQDKQLADWIDSINLTAARGKRSSSGGLGKLVVNVPRTVAYDDFKDALILKIADVNRDPTGTTGIGSKLGKNERRSGFTRLFKTICDYTPEKLEEKLVYPTFSLVVDPDKSYTTGELKINNNNLSHCNRLGLLKKVNSVYEVSALGKLYKSRPSLFTTLFKNQMLLFAYQTDTGTLYPYRLAFEFLKRMGEINFFQFVYGLYSIQFDRLGKPDIDNAIAIAELIKNEFPNIQLTNEANKQFVLDHLNKYHPVGFSFEDVWTDRTTTGNQFRYLIRHLELFGDIFLFSFGKLKIKEGSTSTINNLLAQTSGLLADSQYGSVLWLKELNVSSSL